MSVRSINAMHEERMRDERRDSRAFTAALVATGVAGMLIVTQSDHLMPDALQRSAVDPRTAGMMVLGGMAAFILSLFVGAAAMINAPRPFGWIGGFVWWTTAAWIVTMLWTLDPNGVTNPYVRAAPATQRDYARLAEVRGLPPVAALIRRATADGVLTRGEARDVLEGDVLAKARVADAKRRADADRAAVLAR